MGFQELLHIFHLPELLGGYQRWRICIKIFVKIQVRLHKDFNPIVFRLYLLLNMSHNLVKVCDFRYFTTVQPLTLLLEWEISVSISNLTDQFLKKTTGSKIQGLFNIMCRLWKCFMNKSVDKLLPCKVGD